MQAGLLPSGINVTPLSLTGPQASDNRLDPAITGVDLFGMNNLPVNPKATITNITMTNTGTGWFVLYGATAW